MQNKYLKLRFVFYLAVVERALLTPLDFKEHKGRYGKRTV